MKIVLVAYFFLVSTASLVLFQEKSLEDSITAGKEIYADFCITCHLDKGEGVPNVFPPLAQSDYLMQNREASIRAVKYGQDGEIEVNGQSYNSVMMDPGLTDEEVADVLNYVLNSWGNTSGEQITPEAVAAIPSGK
jgi:mono/diheme cytochrome c family protein